MELRRPIRWVVALWLGLSEILRAHAGVGVEAMGLKEKRMRVVVETLACQRGLAHPRRMLRSPLGALFLSVFLATSVVVGASSASAQFDDEFDAEFGGSSSTADQPSAPSDGFDEDPFGEAAETTDAETADTADTTSPSAESGDVDEAPSSVSDDKAAWERAFRLQPTWYGPLGGIRVLDARTGAVDSFRIQLATDFFFASDFLNDGDQNDHIGGALALSWTAHKYVEVFGSVGSYANANNSEEPSLFQVLGDTILGVKSGLQVLPFLHVGGDFTLALLNTVGDIGLVLDSTSFGLRGNVTADLRDIDSPLPIVAHFNLQYYFDNSGALVEDVESRRYDAIDDARPRGEEDRHLVTRVERFALNINRTDFLNLALGIEAPLEVDSDFYVTPIVEWQWGVPVNRQSYDCLFIADADGSGDPADGGDGCLAKQGLGAFPMKLTVGARVLPPVRGLSGFVAADFGLTGTGTFVRELAATEPYNIMLGLAYAYDTRPVEPEIVVREVEKEVEVEKVIDGRVKGVAVDKATGKPVQEAIVAFSDENLTWLVTGPDGAFTTYRFPPGEVALTVSHPHYDDATCAGVIPDEGGDVEVRCELVPVPQTGILRATVTNADNAAVPDAEFVVSGIATRVFRTDAAGHVNVDDLVPGQYTARIKADDTYLIKQVQFEVAARETTRLEATLAKRPAQPLVRVRAREIQIRRRINFASNKAEIASSSFLLMDEITDVLLRNPEIRKVEIQGHTDNRGAERFNRDLSQKRAESVREWLIEHGVQADRLTAEGYGSARPLVPNITPGNRARNRRVQFVILEREE